MEENQRRQLARGNNSLRQMPNKPNNNNSLTFVEKCKDGFSVGGKSWNVSWNAFVMRRTSTVLFTLNPMVTRDDVTEWFEDATETLKST